MASDYYGRALKQAHYWGPKAGGYDHRYGYDTAAGRAKVIEKVGGLVKMGHIDSGTTVLELGCGTGVFTREIAKVAKQVLAIDISTEMIAEAWGREADMRWEGGGNIEYRVGDFHDLAWVDIQVDVRVDCVVAVYALMYADVGKVLRECRRVLEPGGRVVFVEINGLNPVVSLRTAPGLKALLGVSREARGHTPWWWRRRIARAGFEDVEMEYMGYPMWWLRMVGGTVVIGAARRRRRRIYG
ncbi:hypothetical protein LCGC14_1049040 [marine sediment metagenome]|uniref:Methyltransferase type 11 domain-containing protein n=1 Tax=marine sediment metagenome TaxID=412755 RepID=A0A0F9MTV2_9ZZZZ